MLAPEETIEIHGYALREFRKLRGYKPAELAAKAECDRSYIAKIELGHVRRVSVALLNRLSQVLDLGDSRALYANAPQHTVDAA